MCNIHVYTCTDPVVVSFVIFCFVFSVCRSAFYGSQCKDVSVFILLPFVLPLPPSPPPPPVPPVPVPRGDNVEDVFIETAKKIYQNIQDGK